jgi:hypothetical protein
MSDVSQIGRYGWLSKRRRRSMTLLAASGAASLVVSASWLTVKSDGSKRRVRYRGTCRNSRHVLWIREPYQEYPDWPRRVIGTLHRVVSSILCQRSGPTTVDVVAATQSRCDSLSLCIEWGCRQNRSQTCDRYNMRHKVPTVQGVVKVEPHGMTAEVPFDYQ